MTSPDRSARRRQVHFAQAIGYQAARSGFTVLYRSIFDAVGELMQAEAIGEGPKAMARYLKPDLFILDDMVSPVTQMRPRGNT